MGKLTQKRLRELLRYSPETGIFTWLDNTRRGIRPNAVAGSLNNGYITIAVDGRQYRAHRLAWLHVYGKWPNKMIDHINRIKSDNRIANLREATNAENQRNVEVGKKNKSGFKGVFWEPSRRKWKARAQLNNKKYTIGRFDEIENAIAAYEEFCQKHYAGFYVSQI
ncbi:HNH endonuclease [Xenorhabdus sp. XENO-1]|uniref:HNH endonuclease signature motif containing protein n=1 Tax=Xenorhabdus bovienii TaxID=40576 RepID=UPI0020CA93BD|nr:HNH endonuclease signature motif containing protein [Xenorhabdus bovienii]MCP9269869.1 HNH endonuclease [Xenorhabdus bovienii subsp. africana]